MLPKGEHQSVPLSVLLKRELANEKIEKPELSHGQAVQNKKGEDFTLIKTECQRVLGDGVTTFSVFGLFDGHNGTAAAIYTKENLLKNVMNAIPTDLSRDEWLSALPRALVAGFVKTDKDFQERERTSGTTVTFVIIEGWVVTVASVGDSRCILEIGPLRCWPGGLCLSRSIGDMDVGEYIVPVPYVKQVKLSSAGGRLVIASDGVWDALSAESAVECCRGISPDEAASEIVKGAVQVKGLRDDTTCVVVDVQPPAKPTLLPPSPPKKHGKGVFKAMFRKKPLQPGSQSDKEEFSEPDFVEELFEEGSASLAERFDSKYPVCNMFKPFICAVCQVEIKPGEGISIHAESSNTRKLRPWDGPFLCSSCQEKKEAMEGKRPSGDGRFNNGWD